MFSHERLENINCIVDPSEERGGLFLGDTISTKRADYLIRYNIQAVLSCAPEASNHAFIQSSSTLGILRSM